MARVFIAVLLVVTYCSSAALAGKPCGADPMQDMDDLIASIVPFGNPKVRAPTKVEEIPNFCTYYGNALKDIEDYNSRCISSGYKDKIANVASNLRRNAQDICSKEALASTELTPKKQSFLTLGSCVKSGKPQLRQCITTSKDRILGIHNAPEEQKLALLCCELGSFKKCMFNGITSQSACSSDKSAQKIRDFVANFGSSAIAAACADYKKDPSKCQGLTYPARKASQAVPKSFIISVVGVIKSIDN